MAYIARNDSDSHRSEGVLFTVPTEVAEQLPSVCKLGPSGAVGGGPWTAIKGHRNKHCGYDFCTIASLDAHTMVSYELTAAASQQWPKFQSHPSLHNPESMQLKLKVGNLVLPLEFADMFDESELHKRAYMMTTEVTNGFWAECWAELISGQGKVQFVLRWGWSCQVDPAWTITMQDDVQLVSGGQPFVLHDANRLGFIKINDTTWKLFGPDTIPEGNVGRAGMLPTGTAFHVYGVMMPASHSAPELEHGSITSGQTDIIGDDPPITICGNAAEWAGRFFALGKVPEVPSNVDINSIAAGRISRYNSHAGRNDLWGLKGFGGVWNTGGPGEKEWFVGKGREVLHSGHLHSLRYAATDAGCRFFHDREPSNRRVLAHEHPGLRRSAAAIDERGTDRLGKSSSRAYGWCFERFGPDSQHTGMSYWWLLPFLTPDPAMAAAAKDLIQVYRLGLNHPIGAATGEPRGHRTAKDIVKILYVLEAPWQEKCLELLENSSIYWGNAPALSFSGPVRPLGIFTNPDDRVLRGFYTAADQVPPAMVNTRLHWSQPWQDCTWLEISIEIEAALREFGRTEAADRYAAIIGNAITYVLTYAVARDSSGMAHPITGLKILPYGAANQPSYYQVERTGSSYHEGTRYTMCKHEATGEEREFRQHPGAGWTVIRNGTDMLVGGGGWWKYWLPAAIRAQTLDLPQDVQQVGLEILQMCPIDSLAKAEIAAI